MKLNAICMVKNEADIIIETLKHASEFCDHIYIFDNGSTDGTSELLDAYCASNPKVTVDYRSDEAYKNQLRNRVYNNHYSKFSSEDWWYILDADELLNEDPRSMLERANASHRNSMRVWQAQFYFTDKDLETYYQEDALVEISKRRRYYRINWRELRFFKNDPHSQWPESESGRIPARCNRVYYKSPICRHYAERSPEQIDQRVALRKQCEHGFVHIKNAVANDKVNWLRAANELFYYEGNHKFKFPISDKIRYFMKEIEFWLQWRFNNVRSLFTVLATKFLQSNVKKQSTKS